MLTKNVCLQPWAALSPLLHMANSWLRPRYVQYREAIG